MHLVQNISAHVLKFGDRQFYEDYWSPVAPGRKAKNYSLIVGDWLDRHVYNPVVSKSSKSVASFSVMLVTAVGLEYIVCFANGFILLPVSAAVLSFLPMLLMHKFLSRKADKHPNFYVVLMFTQWLILVLFSGLIVALFMAEHQSRINCPATHSGIKDLLVPRTLSCMQLTGLKEGTLMRKLLSNVFNIV